MNDGYPLLNKRRPNRTGTPVAPQYEAPETEIVFLGEVFLEVITSGVITEREIDWVARNQGRFSRSEEATALRLGRLLDAGAVNPGCRIPSRLIHHRAICNDWVEPLGRRRGTRAAA